jgi:hypothetical protein
MPIYAYEYLAEPISFSSDVQTTIKKYQILTCIFNNLGEKVAIKAMQKSRISDYEAF